MRRQHSQPDGRPIRDGGRAAVELAHGAPAPGVVAHADAAAPTATSVASVPRASAHGGAAHDEAAHCDAARATASATCPRADDVDERGEVLGGLDDQGSCTDAVSLAGWFLRAEARRWDCWELDFDLQHAAGVVRAAGQGPDAGSVLRFDLPQAIAQDCAAPRAASPGAAGQAAAPAWWLACLGCLLLAFGGVLCLLGVRSARDELTTLGSPAAVAGGLMLALAMALQRRRPREVPTVAHGDVPPPLGANWLPGPAPQHGPQSPRPATGPDWSPSVRQVAYLPLAGPGGTDDLA